MRNRDMKNYRAPEPEEVKTSLVARFVCYALVLGLAVGMAWITKRHTYGHQTVQVIAEPQFQQNEQVKL